MMLQAQPHAQRISTRSALSNLVISSDFRILKCRKDTKPTKGEANMKESVLP